MVKCKMRFKKLLLKQKRPGAPILSSISWFLHFQQYSSLPGRIPWFRSSSSGGPSLIQVICLAYRSLVPYMGLVPGHPGPHPIRHSLRPSWEKVVGQYFRPGTGYNRASPTLVGRIPVKLLSVSIS